MRLFHRTPYADAIIANGFVGRSGYYLTDHDFTDVVWFSEDPLLGDQECPDGDVVAVDTHATDLSLYEVLEDGKRREWAVPAEVANPGRAAC